MSDTINSLIDAWRLYDKSELVTVQQINDVKKRMATTPRSSQVMAKIL